tara:strand:+ start:1137 stop:2282 length:1146 start_codon:yes stop_codon:yes gene_type:complete
MKIMILGADGYLGWPTAVELAFKGHNLMLVDNYLKRKLMSKYKKKPLVSSPKLNKKVSLLKKRKCNVDYSNLDCTKFINLNKLVASFKPDAVIHYAELPSAPYSMIGYDESWTTLQNNLQTTLNLIWSIKNLKKSCHIIKLGTMGEYGTPNIDIEEGWINIKHNGRKDKFMYPRQASSLYHTSKIMDTDLLWFYVRMFQIQVTDLMQGPVYGILENEFMDINNLHNTYSYDEMFGTVLNRFIVQATTKQPLTVYGSGNQIRGYINIKDCLKCIELALKNPPDNGDMNIYNQFTEQFSVNQLAHKIKKALKKIDIDVVITKINNPRKEKEKHYYSAKNNSLMKLGLKPTLLTNDEIIKIAQYVAKYKKNIDKSIINPKTKWV